MILSSPMRITALILAAGFAASLIHWFREFRANNSRANNYLPLTGKPLLSRQTHG